MWDLYNRVNQEAEFTMEDAIAQYRQETARPLLNFESKITYNEYQALTGMLHRASNQGNIQGFLKLLARAESIFFKIQCFF